VRQACHEATSNRITRYCHDWHGRGCALCDKGNRSARSDQDVDLEREQLGDNSGQALCISVRIALLEDEVLPYDIAVIGKTSAQAGIADAGAARPDLDVAHARRSRLLRARRMDRAGRRDAHRNERSTPHGSLVAKT